MARRVGLALGAVVLLAACSGSGSTTAPTTAPTTGAISSLGPSGSTTTAPTTPASTAPATPTTLPSGPLAVALDLATGAEHWRRPAAGLGVQGQIAGDVLVVRSCDTNQVTALDLATGDPKWTAPLPCDAAVGLWVVGDVAVAQTTGAVVGLALTDGTTRWRTELPSPVGQGSVVGSGDTAVVQSGPSTIVGLDAMTGTKRWQADGPGGLATLAANDLVVMVSDASGTAALDPTTGAVRWRQALTGPVGPGLALAGSLVILNEFTNGEPSPTTQPTPPSAPPGTAAIELVALDVMTGAERWRHAANSDTAFPAGPVVFDQASGTIAVGWSGANGASGASGSVLEGLGPDGQPRWTAKGVVPVASADGAIVGASSPDAPDPQGTATVAAFDGATGKQRWQASPPIGLVGGGIAGSGVVVVGGPGQDSGGTADQASLVRGLAAADGTQRWNTDAGGVASQVPPAISPGVAAVVVCPPDGSSKVVGFDLASGAKRWDHAGPACGAGGSLPVLSVGGGVLAAATDAGLVGLDATDGHERWTAALGGVPQALTGDATGLVVDGATGKLVGLDPATGKQRWQLDGGDGGAPPIAGSGTLVNAVPDTSGAMLVVTTYDLVTGAPRWHISLPGTDLQAALSGALVVLAVTGQSAADPATPAVALVAFDARTGAQRWRHDDAGTALGLPLVGDPSTGQVVTTIMPSNGDQPDAVAFGPAGQTLWKADGLVATTMGAGLVLAIAGDGSALVALDAASGKERWRSKVPASVGGVGVGDGAVVSLLTAGGSD